MTAKFRGFGEKVAERQTLFVRDADGVPFLLLNAKENKTNHNKGLLSEEYNEDKETRVAFLGCVSRIFAGKRYP